jgi:hypothetical protein
MSKLPLALEIADTVSYAQKRNSSLDLEAKADQLLRNHPEADATRSEIEETLRDEIAEAGVQMGVSRSSRGDKAPWMRTPRFDQPPGQPPSLRWNSVGFPLVRKIRQ